MAEQDDLNIPMIITVGVVSVVLTLAAIFAVQGMYYYYADAQHQLKVVEAPTATADSKLAEQMAKLARYSWVDREQQTVTIPIERAMRLVVQEKRAAADAAADAPNQDSEVQ